MARQLSNLLQGAVVAAAKGARADDSELLRLFAAGDQAAFALLVARHTPMVFGVCRRTLASAADADDACQATFLVLAKKAHSGRWQPSIASWLYGTARRVARNARVVAARRARHEANAAKPVVEPVDAMTGRELLAALDDELDNLSATYREPLVLCYLEGLSREEASARLRVPTGTVKIRLERGRKKLADALTRRGVVGGLGLLTLAVTSPAKASSARMVEAALSAATGKASPAVAALAHAVATGWAKTVVVALFALTFGVAALVAGPLMRPDDGPVLVRHAPPAPAAPPVADEWTFTGRVLDPAGKPLANAKVLVNGPRDTVSQFVPMTTSGPDGRFRFTMNPKTVPERVWPAIAVGAFAEGYGSTTVFANKPELRENLTLWLPAEEVVTGRVIDPEGKPVAGVTLATFVRAAKYRANGQPIAFDAPDVAGDLRIQFVPDDPARDQATTDAAGRFTIRGLSRDWLYDLDIAGPTVVTTKAQIVARRAPATTGYELNHPGRPNVRVVRYGSSFDFVAAPCKPIAGTVREKGSGKPVGGATLRTVGSHLFPTCQVTADAAGRYTLTGLPPGVHTLIVDPPGQTPFIRSETTADARTPGTAPATHDVELDRLPLAVGRVTDAVTGRPLRGSVEYRPLAANKSLEANRVLSTTLNSYRGPTATLDADGRYSVPVLPGEGVLLVVAEGSYTPAALDPADAKPGVVHDEDAELLDTRPMPAWPVQFDAYRRVTAKVGTDITAHFALKPVASRALVLDFPDGKTRDASVLGLDLPARSGSDRYAAGKSAVQRLQPGETRRVYAATVDGSLAGFTDVRAADAGMVRLALQPTASVTGRFVGANGRPLAGIAVRLQYADGLFTRGGYLMKWATEAEQKRLALIDISGMARERKFRADPGTTTDARGEFRIAAAFPGLPFALTAAANDQADAGHTLRQATAKPGETLALGDLPLPAPGGDAPKAAPANEPTFTGRVVDPAGQPVAGAVIVQAVATPRDKPTLTERATSDADGRVRGTVPPPPAVMGAASTLVAKAPGFAADWADADAATAKDGATFRLAPSGPPVRGRIVTLEGQPVAGASVRVVAVAAPDGTSTLKDVYAMWPKQPREAAGLLQKQLSQPAAAGLPETLTTDAAGRFTIANSGVGRLLTLEVAHDAIERVHVRVAVDAAFDAKAVRPAAGAAMAADPDARSGPPIYGPTFDHVARPCRPIVGTVRDLATGKPLAGVVVSARPASGWWDEVTQTTTDAEGRYRLLGLANVLARVAFAGTAKDWPYLWLEADAKPTVGLTPAVRDMALVRGTVLTGRVTDATTGRPIVGGVQYSPLAGNTAVLELPGYDIHRRGAMTYHLNADGRYRVVVPPGLGILTVYAATHDGDTATYPQARLSDADRERPCFRTGVAGGESFRTADNAVMSLEPRHAYRVFEPGTAPELLTADFRLQPEKPSAPGKGR